MVKQSWAGALHWLFLAVLIVCLDLLTKHLASHHLFLGQSKEIFPFLNLTLAHNYGAAFSMLNSGEPWVKWFLSGIAIVVSVVVVIWLQKTPKEHMFFAMALSLILGGAIGNLYDRVVLGYVVDFIDFHIGHWHFAVFNIADAAISIGAILIICDVLFLKKK